MSVPETVPLTEAALFDGQPEEGAADATGTNPDAEIESQAFATPPPLPPKSATPDMGLAAPPPLPPKGAPPPPSASRLLRSGQIRKLAVPLNLLLRELLVLVFNNKNAAVITAL